MSETPDQISRKSSSPPKGVSGRASLGASGSPALYIGIGASAGGLTALQTFFDRMSNDSGAAFIVVQHLSPDFVSHMDELLARHTSMQVQVASHGVDVSPNCVYLIPPKTNITLAGGFLYLSEQVRDGSVNTPIDYFFRSLAEDARHRSVGIILSGTGSDGSRGIKGIKEAGGLVMVQDRDSSEFDGMPYVAAQTGTADLILPPADLAEHLSTFLNSSMVQTAAKLSVPKIKAGDPELVKVFALLATHSGIDFSQYDSRAVIQRVGRRMEINQSKQLNDYLGILESSDAEQNRLAHELLVPISSFFRIPPMWDCIRTAILPSLIENADPRLGLRLWVAGCASGEEAYSLAILVDEVMRALDRHMPFKLFATDIDKTTIKTAITGCYGAEIAHDVSSQRLSRYFIQGNDEYTLRSDIRASVLFSSHDLLKNAPYPSIDLILCRNVLQYFQPRVRMAVLSTFHFSLKDGAMLVLGKSEAIPELDSYYRAIENPLLYFVKIPGSRFTAPTIHLDSSHLAESDAKQTPEPKQPKRVASPASRFEHVKDQLINKLLPACIILDFHYQLQHVYGKASDYFQASKPGEVSVDITHLILDDLSESLNDALKQAKTQSESVRKSNLPCTLASRKTHLSLIAQYFEGKDENNSYYSVVILDEDQPQTEAKEQQLIDVPEHMVQLVNSLESQLSSRQERLKLTNKVLEGTGDKLQSTNEELMSSNEELQSLNEELQSVNEELYTVNKEHQEKIDELLLTRVDLDNVLNATSVSIVFLDHELTVRKFTSSSKRYFNLIDSDLGRPLSNISHRLEYAALHEDIESTRQTHHGRSCEVRTELGEQVQVNILPYHSSALEESQYSAVTLTLTPINSHPSNRAEKPHKIEINDISSVTANLRKPKLRLLIVDDSSEDRQIVRRNLERISTISIDAFEAYDVSTAIQSLLHNNIDACLVDYRLSHETAHDLAMRIRKFNDKLPIVLMSTFAREELSEDLPDSLLDYYLNKNDLSPLLLELSLRHAVGSASSSHTLSFSPDSDKTNH